MIYKVALCTILLFVLGMAFPQPVNQEVHLSIKEFGDTYAAGTVSGLTKPENYKVVIYSNDVGSSRWKKEPHPGNELGYGWARIADDGFWSIRMVTRLPQIQGFVTKYVVLVMRRSATSPDFVSDPKSLNHIVAEIIK